MNMSPPPQLQGGPCKQASSKCGSALSPEPPCPIGTSQSQGRHPYLLSSVPCPCSFRSRGASKSPTTKNQLSEAKTKPLQCLPFHFWEKGHRMNTWLLVCWGTWREEASVV